MDRSDLTVLIPVRATCESHVDWLREAVASVNRNESRNTPVLVGNDGSTVPLGDVGADVFSMPSHIGVCAARNVLGGLCETEYLMWLDADDLLVEGWFEILAPHVQPDRAVYGDMWWFGTGHAVKYHDWPEWDCYDLLDRGIMPVTSIHTKAAWEKVGGFDGAFEEMLEDWDYNIRLMLAGVCGHRVPEAVMRYRRHPEARSDAGRDVHRRMRNLLKQRHNGAKEKDMGCCGGGGGGRRAAQARAAATASRMASVSEALANAEGDLVLVEYTGSKSGTFAIKGRASKQVYRFAANELHRQKLVYRDDAETILRVPEFKMIEVPVPVAVPVVEEDYKPLMPVDPIEPGGVTPSDETQDDLTILSGVGEAKALQLKEMGILTFETLAAMPAELLADQMEGVGVKTAERWVEQAKEQIA